MHISKSLIQAIAVAVTVATTVSACTKDKNLLYPFQLLEKHKKPVYDCPGCGMG